MSNSTGEPVVSRPSSTSGWICFGCGCILGTAGYFLSNGRGPYCLNCFDQLSLSGEICWHEIEPEKIVPKLEFPAIKFQHDKCIIGVDPGSSGGGYAVLSLDGKVLYTGVFKNRSPHDFAEDLQEPGIGSVALVWLEKVHAMPGQGVVSMFSFGENFGMIQGVLATLKLPFELINPVEWQRLQGIKPRLKNNKKKGIIGESQTVWKNRLRAAAQRIFPNIKITLEIADALLIAEAARREYLHRIGDGTNV